MDFRTLAMSFSRLLFTLTMAILISVWNGASMFEPSVKLLTYQILKSVAFPGNLWWLCYLDQVFRWYFTMPMVFFIPQWNSAPTFPPYIIDWWYSMGVTKWEFRSFTWDSMAVLHSNDGRFDPVVKAGSIFIHYQFLAFDLSIVFY